MKSLSPSLLFVLSLAFVLGLVASSYSISSDALYNYDIALRILDGQIPFKDFYFSHGIVAALVFCIFLKLAPTGGFALILASALLNAATAGVAWGMVKKACDRNDAALWAGILTGVWFLPIFGAFYHDHLAYFFVLLAFYVLLACPENIAEWMSGFFLATAFYTKQNVGLGGVAALYITVFFARRQRKLSTITAAYFLTHALFQFGIFYLFDLSNYWKYTAEFPFYYYSNRLFGTAFHILGWFLFPYGINPLQMFLQLGTGRMVFYPVVLFVYLGYLVCYRKRRDSRLFEVLLFCLLSTILCSVTLGRLYVHLFFGMGIVIALSSKRPALAGAMVGAMGVVLFFAGHPIWLPADDFYANTDLFPLKVTRSVESSVNKDLIEFRRARPGSIASTINMTLLSNLALRLPASAPCETYHWVLTVPQTGDLRVSWEKQFVESLENHRTRYIVSDRALGWYGDSPIVRDYLEHKFDKVLTTRSLVIYKKKNG